MDHARVVRKQGELSWWYCRSPGLVVLRADLGGAARVETKKVGPGRRRLRGRVESCRRLTRCRERRGQGCELLVVQELSLGYVYTPPTRLTILSRLLHRPTTPQRRLRTFDPITPQTYQHIMANNESFYLRY
jgi:hypothetical protein